MSSTSEHQDLLKAQIRLPQIRCLGETSTKDGDVFSLRCDAGFDEALFTKIVEETKGLNDLAHEPGIEILTDGSGYAFFYTKKRFATYPGLTKIPGHGVVPIEFEPAM